MVAARIRLCGIDRRLFGGDDDLIGLPIEFDEEVSCLDAVIVIDENFGDLPRHTSGYEGYVTVHVGVIRRDSVKGFLDPGNAKHGGDYQKERDERPNQEGLPQGLALLRVFVF